MANDNETIANIVAEMRELGKLDEKSTDKIPRSLMGLGLRTYADRLEAAAKRDEATAEKSSAVGNAAAMREALEKIREKCVIYNNDLAEEIDALCGNALAAPRRNCDVGTAEDQEKRFYAFCLGNGRRNGGVCDKTCPCYACECLCTFTWAQMPYKEGGAE